MATQAHSDHAAVNQLVGKLNRLASIDASAIERITRAVDEELNRAGGTAKSLSQEHRDLCGHTGVDPETVAVHLAQQRADAAIVAKIPRDQLQIMEILYGQDPSTLAKRYTDLQAQIRDGKVAPIKDTPRPHTPGHPADCHCCECLGCYE